VWSLEEQTQTWSETDGLLVHRLGETTAEDVAIGLLVTAVLRPRRQRKGSLLDIRYFKPVAA